MATSYGNAALIGKCTYAYAKMRQTNDDRQNRKMNKDNKERQMKKDKNDEDDDGQRQMPIGPRAYRLNCRCEDVFYEFDCEHKRADSAPR